MPKLDVTLVGMMMLVDQSPVIVTTGPHSVGTKYHQTEYESACGPTVFRVRFRNGAEENGRVDHLLIDGRPVRGAAATLQMRAARRLINSIELLDCGMDPQRPVLNGMINFEPMESRMLGMRWSLAFRLAREDDDSWRMTID